MRHRFLHTGLGAVFRLTEQMFGCADRDRVGDGRYFKSGNLIEIFFFAFAVVVFESIPLATRKLIVGGNSHSRFFLVVKYK